MAADPTFASTVNAKGILLSATQDTSLTAPSTTVTAFTAGASGSKVEQIRLMQVITTSAAGIINIFLHDGSTYHLFDYLPYSTATFSATAQAAPTDLFYDNLVLPTGWTIRVSNTVQGGTGTTAATHKVIVFGGDY